MNVHFALHHLGQYNYWMAIVLMMIGLYVVMAQGNLVKKVLGLSLFQASVFVIYISIGKVEGGFVPILTEGVTQYSNPLPHVLILTAIVVGLATTSVGLALAVRIREGYGSVEEDDIQRLDDSQNDRGEALDSTLDGHSSIQDLAQQSTDHRPDRQIHKR